MDAVVARFRAWAYVRVIEVLWTVSFSFFLGGVYILAEFGGGG